MTALWIISGMAAAVGIPLWIHLRAGREPEELPWAAMQFLRHALEARKRWIRLRRWALMLLRMLLLALFVLALARLRLPLSSHWPFVSGSGLRIVLVMDDTASVGAEDSATGKSCFEQLRRQAIKTIDRYPSAEFALVFGSKSRAGQWLTPGAARSVLEKAEPTGAGGDLPRTLAAAQATLGESQEGSVVFVFSDHQQTAWPEHDATAPSILARLSASARVGMFGPSSTPPDNLGITSLEAEPFPAVAGKEMTFRTRLTASGDVDRQTVELYVNDAFVGAQVVQGAVAARATPVVFRHTLDTPGVYRIEARLPADGFPGDDSRFLVLDVASDANILCVTDQGDAASTAFVRAILAASKDNPFRFPSDGFAAACWPDETTMLLTANLSEVPADRQDQLAQFLQRGGIWLCFLGPDVRAASYNQLAEAGLLPAKLGSLYGVAATSANSADYFQIDVLRMAHPMFDCGETAEFRRALFAEPRFYQALDIRPAPSERGDATTAGRAAAWFNNGRICAVEGRVGKGTVLLFASSADVRWNSLPLTPAFVLVDRAVHHLLEKARPNRQRNVGEPLSVDAPDSDWFGELLLPNGKRLPSIDADDPSSSVCRWISTDLPGFYSAEFQPKRGNRKSEPLADHYAFNTAADESDLQRASWEQIRERYPDFAFVCEQDSKTPYEVAEEARKGGSRVEISKLLALLALCVLVLESVIAAGVNVGRGALDRS